MIITVSFLPLIGGARGGNGSSMGYVDPNVATCISAACLIFLGYIFFKVRRALQKDRAAKKLTKEQEETAAYRELYEDNFGDKAED